MAFYADTSALAKLVADEPESQAVAREMRDVRVASSELLIVELRRVALRIGTAAAMRRADELLDDTDLMPTSPDILERAASLQPATLRTLDAIHLASAMALGSELEAIVTYDARMAAAAEELGLPVLAPG